MTHLVLDAMGGDLAPASNVEGALLALQRDAQLHLTMVGRREAIEAELRRLSPADGGTPPPRLTIRHASDVIGYDEAPVQAVRQKKDSSIGVGLSMVKQGEAEGFVSAGSTGALMAGSLLRFGRIKGVHRPALVQVMPTLTGTSLVFLDMGAHMNADAEDLVQWAAMGSVYAERVLHRDKPAVALLNVGAEAEKGNEVVKQAHQALLGAAALNFAGNVEGRELMSGAVDVAVADGFVGNVVLKTIEGVTRDLMKLLRAELMASTRAKLGAALAMPALRRIARRFDVQEVGGAPLLGVNGICVKCHGNSTAKAIAAGLRVGAEAVRSDLVHEMSQHLATLAMPAATGGNAK